MSQPTADLRLQTDGEQKFVMPKDGKQYVVKRGGRLEELNKIKIVNRLYQLKLKVENIHGRKMDVDVLKLANEVVDSVFNGITTSELDGHAAHTASNISDSPDYALFAGQIVVSDMEKNIAKRNEERFSERSLSITAYARTAWENKRPSLPDEEEDEKETFNPLISYNMFRVLITHAAEIDREIVWDRNYFYPYFAMMTLNKGKYHLCEHKSVQINLKRTTHQVPFETPQHMWMRVALGLYTDNVCEDVFDPAVHCHLAEAFELYHLLSQRYGTMATPTLFNAGTSQGACASCYLVSNIDDDLGHIYDTDKRCALISKAAGGVGVHFHDVRSAGSYIAGTNGTSNGIVPMLIHLNATARYVDQGGGKRKGSFAVYMEPWHADILDFLQLKNVNTVHDRAARDLFYALWMPDLFFERVKQEYSPEVKEPVMWSLMDPKRCSGLADVYGDEFKTLYESYEAKGRYVRQIPIRDLVIAICNSQIETGVPYILSKGACNRKSNQKNLGTIKSSNLCAEIVEYSSPQETAVCNLASIALPRFVENGVFNFQRLFEVCQVFLRALNRVIDVTSYPVPSAELSNKRHRPVGLGIQGLADVFILCRTGYGSPKSMQLNRDIAETMYFATMTASHALAVRDGPYPSMRENGGAPISHGIFQNDMWAADTPDNKPNPALGWDWEDLRAKVKRDGVRNSLTTAQMPTASTSQILDNPEMFEPYFGMMYVRRTKVGEFVQYCPHFIREMTKLGLWKKRIHPETRKIYIPLKELLKEHRGNIQKIPMIPQHIKDIYRTVYDVPLRTLTLMARDRGLWVDQSQSYNVYLRNRENMMIGMVQYMVFAHKLGLKTISYYTRTQQKVRHLDFSRVNEEATQLRVVRDDAGEIIVDESEDVCVSCSA